MMQHKSKYLQVNTMAYLTTNSQLQVCIYVYYSYPQTGIFLIFKGLEESYIS